MVTMCRCAHEKRDIRDGKVEKKIVGSKSCKMCVGSGFHDRCSQCDGAGLTSSQICRPCGGSGRTSVPAPPETTRIEELVSAGRR